MICDRFSRSAGFWKGPALSRFVKHYSEGPGFSRWGHRHCTKFGAKFVAR
jgi:hypothetical protein